MSLYVFNTLFLPIIFFIHSFSPQIFFLSLCIRSIDTDDLATNSSKISSNSMTLTISSWHVKHIMTFKESEWLHYSQLVTYKYLTFSFSSSYSSSHSPLLALLIASIPPLTLSLLCVSHLSIVFSHDARMHTQIQTHTHLLHALFCPLLVYVRLLSHSVCFRNIYVRTVLTHTLSQ